MEDIQFSSILTPPEYNRMLDWQKRHNRTAFGFVTLKELLSHEKIAHTLKGNLTHDARLCPEHRKWTGHRCNWELHNMQQYMNPLLLFFKLVMREKSRPSLNTSPFIYIYSVPSPQGRFGWCADNICAGPRIVGGTTGRGGKQQSEGSVGLSDFFWQIREVLDPER